MEATERDVLVTPADLGLTERQGDILALLLDGLPNKRIAQARSLSESTVKEHVSAVLARMGAHSRVELMTRLRGQRLVRRPARRCRPGAPRPMGCGPFWCRPRWRN